MATWSSNNTSLSTIFNGVSNNVIEHLNSRLETLEEKLKGEEKSASLILGAGVSISVGLPSWDSLLMRAAILAANKLRKGDPYGLYGDSIPTLPTAMSQKQQNKYYDEAVNIFSETDILELATYLFPEGIPNVDSKFPYSVLSRENTIPSDTRKFFVRQAMLSSMHRKEDCFQWEKIEYEKSTLESVTRLCKAYFSTKQGTKNRSIVTYNFDNLLEESICRNSDSPAVVAVYDGEKHIVANENRSAMRDITIYHPHGYIDICHKESDSSYHESKDIVLSEDSYRNLETKVYRQENISIIRALHDDVCIFVGFSGNDYNFRRILKNMDNIPDPNMPQEQFSRYIFVALDDVVKKLIRSYLQAIEKMDEEEKVIGYFLSHSTHSEKPTKDIYFPSLHKFLTSRLLTFLSMKEEYWRQKGFLPIWSTIEDLPKMLSSLL